MKIESIMTIYHILTAEAEKRERAYKAAREELNEAREIDDNKGHIDCLETIKDRLYEEYSSAQRALDDLADKDWN